MTFKRFRSYDVMVFHDEAETVLHGKSILKNGYPRMTDPSITIPSKEELSSPRGSDAYHTWSYLYLTRRS